MVALQIYIDDDHDDDTETENVIFYVSYGVITEFLRISVILTYFCNGQRRCGNGVMSE